VNLAYPYHFDGRGLTAESTDQAHVRDLIEQVLFTAPGERVMRPSFGSGVAQLVFAPNSTALASATQMLVQGALQQFLANLIAVRAVSVEADDNVLSVTVQYSVRGSDQLQVQTFRSPAGGAS
jgi:phage baseplate assembly protein W